MADNDDAPRQVPVAGEEDNIGGPALPMDRYHLRAPIFSGEEDVEQFITEFSNVAAICRWPARVTLIQLRLCLTRPAKPYEISQDVGDIFEALRARFGLTTRDARAQLQGFRRNPKTNLREHATVVERLAQVAYGDMPAESRRSLALDAFLQSINNLGLKQHLLVAEVETLERALRLGNAYFHADSACWAWYDNTAGRSRRQRVDVAGKDSCTCRHGGSQRANQLDHKLGSGAAGRDQAAAPAVDSRETPRVVDGCRQQATPRMLRLW